MYDLRSLKIKLFYGIVIKVGLSAEKIIHGKGRVLQNMRTFWVRYRQKLSSHSTYKKVVAVNSFALFVAVKEKDLQERNFCLRSHLFWTHRKKELNCLYDCHMRISHCSC